MKPFIKVKNLSKTYVLGPQERKEQGIRKKKALKGVSFTVKKGECFGLIGPLDSGKTTVIRALLNRTRTRNRQITIDGMPAYMYKSKDMISAEHYLESNFYPQAYYDICAGKWNLEERENVRRRDMLFRKFGLSDVDQELMRDLPLELQKRVSLTLGMTNEPEVIFYDEAREPLEDDTYKLLIEYLEDMKAKGKTIIMAVQWDLRLVEKMCDSVGIMAKGNLIACDTMENICQGRTLRWRYCEIYADYIQSLISRYAFVIS